MKIERNSTLNIDTIGASASLLCAIHCALVPLVLTFGVMGGSSFFTDPMWEVALFGVSFLIASFSLINGYRRHHRRLAPLSVAVAGFILITLGHFVFHSFEGHWLAALGGVLIALAHYLNYKACNTCRACRD